MRDFAGFYGPDLVGIGPGGLERAGGAFFWWASSRIVEMRLG
jgi:hypothetical protein